MLVPFYGFLRGDTIGMVVLVHDHQTMADVASVLQQAASVRVKPAPRAQVFIGGHAVSPSLTVKAAGLSALDRVDVVGEH